MRSAMCGTLVVAFVGAALPVASQSNGRFEGQVVVEWLESDPGPDRDMRLVQSFLFRDGNGNAWEVPAGAVVNGASIPRVFWTLVGSPLVGDHRRASVVHDHFCAIKSRPWEEVHRMFFHALVASGFTRQRAKVFYVAVYAGGPRWSKTGRVKRGTPEFVTVTPEFSEHDFRTLEEWILNNDPTLNELEREVQRVVSQ